MNMIRERRSCRDESVVPRADALGGNRNRRSRLEIMPVRDRATRLSERWDQPRFFREPYDFPTQQKGDFANVMSAMARDSKEANKRTGLEIQNFQSKFNEQVSQALALKLNLSTHQHVNEKALEALRNGGAIRCSLKQTVQARAAIYDSTTAAT